MEAERERLRAAAEQERLQRRQQQSQRLESLGQLIGGVAHDFNNLLNVISGYADFTAEQLQPLAAERPAARAGARRTSSRCAAPRQQAIRVTRQLLTFAKSDAAHREVLDLNEVVDSAGQLLRRSLGSHIELVITAEPGLWPVEADRGQLEQVLVNLAVNARDAMPGGGRLTIATGNAEVDEVYAEQRPNLSPGRYCRLAVSDTGSGMDAATIERVFEPFFSTKPRGRGTGLGLATVYGIVSGIGGTIDVYSEVGLGTTMNVLLPVTAQAAAAEQESRRPRADGQREAGQGETILLVEDEPSLRAMAGRILARNGYRVREAPDGAGRPRAGAGHQPAAGPADHRHGHARDARQRGRRPGAGHPARAARRLHHRLRAAGARLPRHPRARAGHHAEAVHRVGPAQPGTPGPQPGHGAPPARPRRPPRHPRAIHLPRPRPEPESRPEPRPQSKPGSGPDRPRRIQQEAPRATRVGARHGRENSNNHCALGLAASRPG